MTIDNSEYTLPFQLIASRFISQPWFTRILHTFGDHKIYSWTAMVEIWILLSTSLMPITSSGTVHDSDVVQNISLDTNNADYLLPSTSSSAVAHRGEPCTKSECNGMSSSDP